jgi:HEAT repeat protein
MNSTSFSSSHLDQLHSDDADTRLQALAELGDDDFERLHASDLLPFLHDEDHFVRQLALRALGDLNDVAAIPAVLDAVADPVPGVAAIARATLAHFRSRDAVDPLTAGVAHWSPEVRAAAVASLRELRNPRAIPALRAAVDDHSVIVRKEAVLALGRFREPGVLALLRWSLYDHDVEVRKAAVAAVGSYGLDATLADLVRALHDHDWQVRREAAAVLARFPENKIAVYSLRQALRDRNPEVVREAIVALGKGKGPVDEDLEKFLDHPLPELRAAAATALGELGLTDSRFHLSALLQDDDAVVVRSALKAIRRLDSLESQAA